MSANPIHILPSVQSPEVLFVPEEGRLLIMGRSVMLDVDEFYQPVIDAFSAFKSERPAAVTLLLDLEYFSYTSLKKIMYFLYDMKEMKDEGSKVEVIWRRNKGDADIAEMVEEMSNLLKLSFTAEYKDAVLTA